MSPDQTVISILEVLLDVDPDTLTAQTTLDAIEAWDSVNALRVLVFLEQELGRPLDYDAFSQARTISDLGVVVDRLERSGGQHG
jgi:acyl carrier protein